MYFSSFVDLGGGLWSRPDVYDEGPHAARRAAVQNIRHDFHF